MLPTAGALVLFADGARALGGSGGSLKLKASGKIPMAAADERELPAHPVATGTRCAFPDVVVAAPVDTSKSGYISRPTS